MRAPSFPLALLAALVLPTAALASDTDTKTAGVTGHVPLLCYGGALSGTDSTFALGLLTDTNTGLLRTDLAAPDKLLSGAFCNTGSTITIAATQLVAQTYRASPPNGFSRAVDYVASASGWTASPATYNTALSANSSAIQTRSSAFSGNITVSIGGFATTGGGTLQMVPDNSYAGTVTVTLSPMV